MANPLPLRIYGRKSVILVADVIAVAQLYKRRSHVNTRSIRWRIRNCPAVIAYYAWPHEKELDTMSTTFVIAPGIA